MRVEQRTAYVTTPEKHVRYVEVKRFAIIPTTTGGLWDVWGGSSGAGPVTAAIRPVLVEPELELLQLVPPGADPAKVLQELKDRDIVKSEEP